MVARVGAESSRAAQTLESLANLDRENQTGTYTTTKLEIELYRRWESERNYYTVPRLSLQVHTGDCMLERQLHARATCTSLTNRLLQYTVN